MLFILFQLGADRYAIEATKVVEVLPLMQMKSIPQAPRGVAGVLNYRGEPLPVIDLSALALGRPAAQRLSTRILVVDGCDGRRLALVAERANETLKRRREDFTDAGVHVKDAPYLGPVTREGAGFVQWVDPETLLP